MIGLSLCTLILSFFYLFISKIPIEKIERTSEEKENRPLNIKDGFREKLSEFISNFTMTKLFTTATAMAIVILVIGIMGISPNTLGSRDDSIDYQVERLEILRQLDIRLRDAQITIYRAGMSMYDNNDPDAALLNQEEELFNIRIHMDDLIAHYRNNLVLDSRLTPEQQAEFNRLITAYETEVHHYFNHYIIRALEAVWYLDGADAWFTTQGSQITLERAMIHFNQLLNVEHYLMWPARTTLIPTPPIEIISFIASPSEGIVNEQMFFFTLTTNVDANATQAYIEIDDRWSSPMNRTNSTTWIFDLRLTRTGTRTVTATVHDAYGNYATKTLYIEVLYPN